MSLHFSDGFDNSHFPIKKSPPLQDERLNIPFKISFRLSPSGSKRGVTLAEYVRFCQEDIIQYCLSIKIAPVLKTIELKSPLSRMDLRGLVI